MRGLISGRRCATLHLSIQVRHGPALCSRIAFMARRNMRMHLAIGLRETGHVCALTLGRVANRGADFAQNQAKFLRFLRSEQIQRGRLTREFQHAPTRDWRGRRVRAQCPRRAGVMGNRNACIFTKRNTQANRRVRGIHFSPLGPPSAPKYLSLMAFSKSTPVMLASVHNHAMQSANSSSKLA